MSQAPQYTFPAEWHSQQGVMLAWPHQDTDWADNLDAAEQCYQQITRIISQYESVLILCKNQTHQAHIEHLLCDISMSCLYFVQVDYNDTWIRDYGFIRCLDKNGNAKLLNFIFNAWGGKFDADLDNTVNYQLFKKTLFSHYLTQDIDFILEGGSIETDGKGTLLTTETCLLNVNRNPKYNKADIDRLLKKHLGIERILWLKQGELIGDDTDAHIDTLARFASEYCIVYVQDESNPSLVAMEKELQQLLTKAGKPYELIPLPYPSPAVMDHNDRQLASSYANFLIINNAVLVPTYGVKEDKLAQRQLQKAFPDRKIETVNCRALIQQNGSLHCVSMQF